MGKDGLEKSGREPNSATTSKLPRVAPGKVTRTSKLASGSKQAVQRRAPAGEREVASPKVRSMWEHTLDPWMDAAHRGTRPPGYLSQAAQVQAKGNVEAGDLESVHRAAAAGIAGSGGSLPHHAQIQESFGATHDLSRVRAHVGGAAAEASDAMGAEAYASGECIAFRNQPDLHTAAHEAAHVVQQQQGVQLPGGVGRAGDAYERHADAVADRVVAGQSAADLLAAGPAGCGPGGAAVMMREADATRTRPGPGESAARTTSSQSEERDDSSWWQELADDAMEMASDAVDYVGERIGEVVDDVTAWGIDQIENLEDLMVYIAEVGEDAARWLMAQVIEHKVEIAVAFLTANPACGLAVFVFRRLPVDILQSWLASIDVQILEQVIKAAIAVGAVAAVAGILFALGQSSIPLVRELTPALLYALWQHVPEDFRQFVLQTLVDYWPVGLGLALDGSIGVTFGVPVHLGGEAYFEISHFTEGQFKLRRGGVLIEALDTGLGAGGDAGLGGGKGGRGGDGNPGGLGIGGEVGVQAQAGLKQVVHQEFDFPASHDDAFLAFLLAVAGNDIGSPKMVLGLFSRELQNIHPDSYNTRTSFEIKAFAEGNAAASAGLRSGGENTQEGGSTWNNREGAADTGKTKWWQRWLRAGIFGRIALEAGVGLEYENQEWTEDAEGVRVPARMKVEASGEASAALALVHSIPVISQALPAGVDFEGGAGIKVSWILSGGVNDTDPQISSPTYSLFTKTGSMDRYEGAASETSIAIGNLDADTFSSLDSFLQKISAGAEIRRRFNVGLALGRKYFLAAQRDGAFNVMLPAEYRNYGFRVEGYVDLEAQLTAEQVRGIFRSIASVSTGYQEGGAPLQQLYQDVVTFLSTGHAPPHVMQELEAIANHVLASLRKLHLHGLVGLSVAAGAKLSAGAKARLNLGFGAQITMDHDLLQHVQGSITVEDIEELLRNPNPGGDSALEIEGNG